MGYIARTFCYPCSDTPFHILNIYQKVGSDDWSMLFALLLYYALTSA